MKWRARAASSRAKERANMSFFIFIMFFAVFGIIVLTELFMLDRPTQNTRSHYEDLQNWMGRTEKYPPIEVEFAPPAQTPQDGVWQPVAGTRFRFYVYSAWVERRTVAAIRVIAATKTRGPDAVFCRLWLPDNRTLTLKARVQAIREHWNWKFSATYVLCLLRDTGVNPQETAGASVAVVASLAPNRPATNLLLIQDTQPKPGIEKELHVCVKPFHFKYQRDEWVVEWIEMNRLLGVTHFYMYNKSVSDGFNCVLNHYKQKGLITLLPWKLPIQQEIRTEGQFAAFNDCLYRSMSNAKWLLVIDSDELVLPRKVNTLLELIKQLDSSQKLKFRIAAFLFRNAFFYVRWDDDPKAELPLLTARKTRRLVATHALKNRSKFVVRPSEVVELGNHFIWEHVPGANSLGVSVDNALLHHYREQCKTPNCLKLPTTIDRTALKWSKELWERVQKEQKLIKQGCKYYGLEQDEEELLAVVKYTQIENFAKQQDNSTISVSNLHYTISSSNEKKTIRASTVAHTISSYTVQNNISVSTVDNTISASTVDNTNSASVSSTDATNKPNHQRATVSNDDGLLYVLGISGATTDREQTQSSGEPEKELAKKENASFTAWKDQKTKEISKHRYRLKYFPKL